MRTCVACRAIAPREVLLRFTEENGHAVLDTRRALPGRGAWVHPWQPCLAKGLTPAKMSRAFRSRVHSVADAQEAVGRHVWQGQKTDGTNSASALQAERKRVGS